MDSSAHAFVCVREGESSNARACDLQLYQQLRRRAILRSTEAKRRKIDPRTAVLRGRLVPEEEVPTRLRGRAVGWKLAVLYRYRVLK
jgi:hypothetical protein